MPSLLFDESMRKSILVGMMTTLAMSLFVVAETSTGPFNILLPANADPDGKVKVYESGQACIKDNDSCKIQKQVIKETRDFCDDFSDSDSERKCKQEHDD
jgi:hypothetical protein